MVCAVVVLRLYGLLSAERARSMEAEKKLAEKERELEAAKKRPPSKDAAEVLHDLMAGGAVLRVTRLDENDFFMLSPRTQR